MNRPGPFTRATLCALLCWNTATGVAHYKKAVRYNEPPVNPLTMSEMLLTMRVYASIAEDLHVQEGEHLEAMKTQIQADAMLCAIGGAYALSLPGIEAARVAYYIHEALD